jgi:hypothetical protein
VARGLAKRTPTIRSLDWTAFSLHRSVAAVIHG